MKFLIIATLFAATSANSYDPTSTPAYQTPSTPTYEAPSTYQPESYIPKPYSFSWQLNDPASYNNFDHSESSDGKVISGSYRVALPDGRTQIVTYKDDSNGYVAIVKYEGEAKYPEYKPSASYPVPSYKSPAPVSQVLAGSSYQGPTTPASSTQYNTLATVATSPYTTPSTPEYKIPVTRAYRAPVDVAPKVPAAPEVPAYKPTPTNKASSQ
ncbi:cuticle protein 19-like [Daphnia carinata]|uniref:cuticle protein 19-like n=1 Tax=Daphnia carinata TaxID=120202 RepID=UPI00257EE046|nr:cuticle protein 19-like [Daphnia carinata]